MHLLNLLGWAILLGLVVVILRFINLWFRKKALRAYWLRTAKLPIKNDEFVIVALGDSTMQGVGATKYQHTAVGWVGKLLAASLNKSVHISNVSRSGSGIDDVLYRQIQQAPIARADLILISVGANDILAGMSYATFTKKYAKLLAQLPRDKVVVADVPLVRNRRDKNLAGTEWNPKLKDFFAAQKVRRAPIFELVFPRRFDPRIYAAVTLLFGMIAILACLVPSLRASRIDPIIALRTE